jgi:putative Ca2+/H+ antiporter (TMEM165/GDT1 family)
MRAYVTIFLRVLLAELGDKTQLATLVYATDASLTRWGVIAAAAAALLLSTILAVVAGSVIGIWLEARQLRIAAALAFIAIGLWMLIRT